MSERMWIWLGICAGIAATMLCAALSHAQVPANIVRPWDGTTLKTTWPAGTESVRCELAPIASTQVGVAQGTAGTVEGMPVSFVLAMPAAEVRCRACNTAGCSELSPNALQIQQRSRADCNGDGATNVSDITCYVRVIYGGQP